MAAHRFFITVVSALILASSVFAQFLQNRWHTPAFSTFPASSMDSSGVPVRIGTSINWQRAVVPGANSDWFYAWTGATTTNRAVYCGRIDSNGDTLWKKTVNAVLGFKDSPVLLGTSDGGVMIAWANFGINASCAIATSSIMVQKLDMNGNRLWNVDGTNDSLNAVMVCSSVISDDYYRYLQIVGDGTSGCYVVWKDTRNSGSIYSSHLTSSGTFATGFTVGGKLMLFQNAQEFMRYDLNAISDNRGGAWVMILGSGDSSDICLQQLRSNGTTRWDSLGHLQLTNRSLYYCWNYDFHCAVDGRGGAFMVWKMENLGLYELRIDSTGQAMWLPDSSRITETCPPDMESVQIIPAGTDTCIVSWEDIRSEPTSYDNPDIYVQKITGDTAMVKLWGSNDVAVCTESHQQNNHYLENDGSNGCIVAWEDERNFSTQEIDVYAQRVNSQGTPVWTSNGVAIAAYVCEQMKPICSVSNTGILFLFTDGRLGSNPLYRIVYGLNGVVTTPFQNGPAKTVDDIGSYVFKQTLVKQGSGKVVAIWQDYRKSDYGSRIYLSQYDVASGALLSSIPNGTPLTIDSTYSLSQGSWDYIDNLLGVGTSDSCAIIVYNNLVGTTRTLRAQKISYTGTRLWGGYGIEVGSPELGFDYLNGVAGGNGGVYFTYSTYGDAPNYDLQLRFQHINANGQLASPIAPIVHSSTTLFSLKLVCSDSAIYLGFIEQPTATDWYGRVQLFRMNSDGTIRWQRTLAMGYDTSSTHGFVGERNNLNLVPAANGSVVASWLENMTELQGMGRLYTQKVDSSGNFLWGASAKPVAATSYCQLDPQTVQSGDAFWYAWQEDRGNWPHIYLQRFSETGQTSWDTAGIEIAYTGSVTMTQHAIVPDASGGVFVSYTRNMYNATNYTTISDGLVATHLDQSGAVVHSSIWNPATPSGVAYISNMSLNGYPVSMVPTNDGVILAWLDGRTVNKIDVEGIELQNDLYIQRITDENVSVHEVSAPVPKRFTLEQNYPNPFNSTTHFKFTLPASDRVKLIVYDVTGREVIRLLDEVKLTGTYDVRWNGKNSAGQYIASGMYFYRLETTTHAITKKMTLLK